MKTLRTIKDVFVLTSIGLVLLPIGVFALLQATKK